MNPKVKVERLFDNLQGQITWSVRQTHGSCFFMELGNPHQEIREPLPIREGMSAARALKSKRRRVSFRGDWSLLVLDCNWSLSVWEFSANQDSTSLEMKCPFEGLDGQYLKSVRYESASKIVMLTFDLGAELRLWPSESASPLDEQWSLCSIGNVYHSLLGNGEIVVKTGSDL
jgi:hypothetical protein